ncbi:hypothetical protein [Jeongeupia naejangsanensis]|uniref:Uncharacterized protein n=1 Tax=Jeongeupia naejangsanensis TaxID=613195 RepID=A0ABS2BH39_9NEIS|nr:hypothetical protein [Jeongeupia naejangsanensis]MBM3114924.1 hypothetical protein [Jeongeupia naejangsanensis]
MPFAPPFREYFTKGDLIYGLAPSRTGLIIKFFGANLILSKDTKVEFVATTVDHYRGETFSQKIMEYDQAYAAETIAYDPKYNQGKIDEAQKRRSDRKAVAFEFIRELGNFRGELAAHPKYGRYLDSLGRFGMNEAVFADKAKEVESNSAWRAKSKFGMEWTIKKNADPVHPARNIHFVLDDLDMAAVVTKTHRFEDASHRVLAQDSPAGKANAGEDKLRTITHSELRWIYRNRNNPLVQRSVQFWLDKTPCVPPWENTGLTTKLPVGGTVVTWKDAWVLYEPSLTPDAFS